jgi:hypothetical protein
MPNIKYQSFSNRYKRRHDNQHNDTQYSASQDDTQHNDNSESGYSKTIKNATISLTTLDAHNECRMSLI